METYLQEALYAFIVIVLGIVVGRVVTNIVLNINAKTKFSSRRSIQKVLHAFRTGIFLLSIIFALSILRVEFARTLWRQFIDFIPSIFVLLLVALLGYAIISLLFDFAAHIAMHYADDYLQEFGISKKTVNIGLFITKIFLLLIFAAIALRIADLSVDVVDWVIVGLIFAFIGFNVIIVAYAFKDYLANFLLSGYVSRNILRVGQHVKIDNEVGEVMSITNHGAVIIFDTGYQKIIPNAELVQQELTLKRVRSDIHRLERIIPKFIAQLPAFCGPASTAMLLNFFGYAVAQETVAKAAKTRAPPKRMIEKGVNYTDKGNFGNEPEELIKAVRKLTKGAVKGKLIRYDEIEDLSEELKVWFTEGALPILWYKKPILFPDKPSRAGHYVLGVGVEDQDIIIMDPSSQTAGVYMVNYEFMEEAMADHDKARGYIVFAKKGSPAYWRLTEGLYYSNTTLYKNLSKSFERYLKKTLRASGLVKDFTSPFVEFFFDKDEDKIKHLWKPNLGGSHGKK